MADTATQEQRLPKGPPLTKFSDAELAKLSIPFRNALTAHVCNGQKYSQIAADQAIPIGTVRSRINRARRHVAAMREFEANKAKEDARAFEQSGLPSSRA